MNTADFQVSRPAPIEPACPSCGAAPGRKCRGIRNNAPLRLQHPARALAYVKVLKEDNRALRRHLDKIGQIDYRAQRTTDQTSALIRQLKQDNDELARENHRLRESILFKYSAV